MKSDHRRQRAPSWDKIWYSHSLHNSLFDYPLVLRWAGESLWTQDHSYQREVSDIFGIEQVIDGNARLVQDGKESIVKPGEAYLLREGSQHSYGVGPAGYLLKRFVCIGGTLVNSLLRTTGLWEQDVLKPSYPGDVTALLRKAATLLRKKESNWIDRAPVLAFEIILHLIKALAPPYPHAIDKARLFIESNLQQSLTARQICANTGFSQTHFNRIFKSHLGMSPVQYMISQRVSSAKRLLADTSLSIKEIAATVGYEDQLSFSALFKKHAEVSPKAYRVMIQKQNGNPAER